jgi:regulator of RNase E activity RraA
MIAMRGASNDQQWPDPTSLVGDGDVENGDRIAADTDGVVVIPGAPRTTRALRAKRAGTKSLGSITALKAG